MEWYARTMALILAVGLATMAVGLPGAEATPTRSCGTVKASGSEYGLTITKGSPGCKQVRAVGKNYGHPKSTHYSCPERSHICAYGVYQGGWRCTGLFQGTYGCWLGGNAKGRHASASFQGALTY